jgi:hypothetical protein
LLIAEMTFSFHSSVCFGNVVIVLWAKFELVTKWLAAHFNQ